MKQKILFVCNDSVLFGSERALLNILDHIDFNTHDITILLPRKGELENELNKRNVRYLIVRYYSWAVEEKNIINLLKFLIKHIINKYSLIKMSKIIKKEHFDIVHSMNSCVYFGSMIAKKYNIKHIWHLREYNVKYACKWLMDKEFFDTDLFICISQIVYSKILKMDYPNVKYTIIYDGLKIDKKNKTTIPIISNNHFNLLIAGTINKNKGQIIAIKAVEYLICEKKYDLELYIAGYGELENDYKEYVNCKGLQDKIHFLGYRDDLNNIRKKMNIYLMCSYKEGWGYVTIESLLYKNLVIASNSGGSLEIIKDNINGLLFECGSWNDLSNKIEYAINNWNKMKKMINYGYEDAMEKYNIDTQIMQLESIYNDFKSY